MSNFCDRVQGLAEVLECHHLAGEFDYLLKFVVVNHQHLEKLLREEISPIPGVDKIKTSIAIDEVKASTSLPLD